MDYLGESFLHQIASDSGQPIAHCYQCRKCTAGCPTAHAMDFDPSQIVRLVQLGQREAALASSAIWLCVGCETCGTRCPNQICVGKIADALKARAAGRRSGQPAVTRFHRAFLHNIQLFGRVHEVTMLVEYKLRAGNLLADLWLGLRLLLAGKLPAVPRHLRARRGVAPLFAAARARRSETTDEEGSP
jgi:heterodisulfide reductase subunit C